MADKLINQLDELTSIADNDELVVYDTDAGATKRISKANLDSDKIETSYLDTDGTLSANSDVKIATQKAVKTYADTKQTALGYTAENSANKKTSLTDDSDTFYPTQKAVKTAVDAKQDTLVSGTNIKTVNSTTLLGSGDLAVQETLVSGTNIKTINSTSLLGSGNIDISGGSGDVIAPASNTDNNIPQWDGNNSKTLKDGLSLVTTIGTPGADTSIPTEQAVREAISSAGGGDVSGPASSTNNNIAVFDGETGKLIKDGGATIASKQDALTFGIADTNAVKIDSADVADDEYARFTANGLESRSATEVKQDLDLEIGTDVQAYDSGLTDIAGLAVTDGNIIVGDGTNWVAESGATARTSLGLGTSDSPQFTGIELGNASDTTLSRSAAGVLAVEGVVIPSISSTNTLTNKTIDADNNTISNLAIGSEVSSTIGADITTNNFSILRKSIPSADNRGEGDIVTDIVAGETIAFPNLVYLKSDGKWWKADADAIASCSLLGIALESKNADEACKVLLRGFIRDDDWAWTVAGAIYASVTAGGLSQTAVSGEDDVVALVGWATHADRMYFNPDNTRIEYKA